MGEDTPSELADIVKEVSRELSESFLRAIFERRILESVIREFALDLRDAIVVREPMLPGGFRPDLMIMFKDVAVVIEFKASRTLPSETPLVVRKYAEVLRKVTGIEKVYSIIVCLRETKIEESVEELAKRLDIRILRV